MRKVLILIALLPGLALADPVGGPTTSGGIQTSSPQNATVQGQSLQPAPDAGSQSLAAPSAAQTLQGSTPTTDQQALLQTETEGQQHTLGSTPANGSLAAVLLGAAAAVLVLAALSIWQLAARGLI